MNDCINKRSSLYSQSQIPVVIFSSDMDIIWNNIAFGNYFGKVTLEGENLSAITKTALRKKLLSAQGFSLRLQATISPENFISSLIVMLIFPLEFSNDSPVSFIGYIDDITSEHNMMLRKTYLGLLEASKLKDDDTGNHIKRVGAYARRLSEECYKHDGYPQINPDFIDKIHFLAPMHDVGKIGTPDEILTKRGPLDESEWSIMKQHTINGALILSNYPDKMASEIARAHHERWDGSGYLFGLQGEDIPLAARITTIADVYDALRMKRSYKEAFSHEKAVEIIESDSGKLFDPALVDIFFSINDSFMNIYNALSDEADFSGDSVIEDLPVYVEDAVEELAEIEENEEIEELEEL